MPRPVHTPTKMAPHAVPSTIYFDMRCPKCKNRTRVESWVLTLYEIICDGTRTEMKKLEG